jgi:hypothetical protein
MKKATSMKKRWLFSLAQMAPVFRGRSGPPMTHGAIVSLNFGFAAGRL